MKLTGTRILAWVMALLLAVGGSGNTLAVFAKDAESTASVTTETDGSTDGSAAQIGAAAAKTLTLGQVIAANYSMLDAKEKAILSCAALYGDRTYTVHTPDSGDGLVTVDTAKRTLSAKSKADGNYSWKPTVAKVIYKNSNGGETPITVTLDSNGNGTFNCPAEQYRVEVTYELRATVEDALQKTMLNVPADLADGIVNLEAIYRERGKLNTISSNIDKLNMLTEDSFILPIESGTPEYAAIRALYNDCQSNGGKFSLYNRSLAYHNAANKTQVLVEQGADFLRETKSMAENIAVICDHESQVVKIVALGELLEESLSDSQKQMLQEAQTALEVLEQLGEILGEIAEENWHIVELKPVQSGVSATAYSDLNTAVLNAVNIRTTSATSRIKHYPNPSIVKSLTVASTTIVTGVNRYTVNVTVSAQVIDPASVNTSSTVTLPQKLVESFVMEEGTTSAQIQAAVLASGIKTRAFAAFDPAYEVNDDHYDLVFTGVPSSLSTNINCEMVFRPKTLTVTFQYETTVTQSVKYGYRLLLPAHADRTKSYDYRVNGLLRRENTVQVIRSNTVISRTEGSAVAKYRIPAVIAGSENPGNQLGAEELAVLRSLALVEDSVWYRLPLQSANLVSIAVGSGNTYTVTAASCPSGLPSGAEWEAVQGYVYDATGKQLLSFPLNGGSGAFICAKPFATVKLHYELRVRDITATEVNAWVNLPDQLVSDAKKHREMMRYLEENLYDALGRVKGVHFDTISALSVNYSAAAQEAIQLLLDEAVNEADTGRELYLYKYLTDYNRGELAYYYEGDNAEKIAYQLKLLQENLDIICEDKQFYTDVVEAGLESYYEWINQIRAELKKITVTPVSTRINRQSEHLSSLVAALDRADGSTKGYNLQNPTVLLTSDLTVAAPGSANIMLTVQVKSSSGELSKGPAVTTLSFPLGTANDAALQTQIQQALAKMEKELGVDSQHYARVCSGSIPATVNGDVALVYTWNPRTYTVAVEGAELQSFPADGSLSFTLPACEDTTKKYCYTIGKKTVTVGSEARVYWIESLAELDLLMGADGVIRVSRRYATDSLRGDVNGDGLLSIGDVSTLLSLLSKDKSIDNPAADVDGNGVISIGDVSALLSLLS